MDGLNHINSWLSSMKRNPTWQILLESAGSIASGAAFGAALTAAGVQAPEIIIKQFRLQDFRMFQVFTVALGSSVFVILALDRLNIVKRQIRPSTSLGYFSKYDGNIIGGALVGLGMSMSGSCPGTVTVQLAQGVPTAIATATGGLLGGMAHLWLTRPMRRPSPTRRPTPTKALRAAATNSPSITNATGLSEVVLYTLFAAVTVSLLFASTRSLSTYWQSPGAGGLYLGTAQLLSLLLTSTTLGASGIYDQAGRYAWRLLGQQEVTPAPSPPKSLLFATGSVAGSALLTALIPSAGQWTGSSPISYSSALVGGFVMTFGAKIAKGCTSGHGLSGLGSLSYASLISVASMFGAGIAYQFV